MTEKAEPHPVSLGDAGTISTGSRLVEKEWVAWSAETLPNDAKSVEAFAFGTTQGQAVAALGRAIKAWADYREQLAQLVMLRRSVVAEGYSIDERIIKWRPKEHGKPVIGYQLLHLAEVDENNPDGVRGMWKTREAAIAASHAEAAVEEALKKLEAMREHELPD